MFGRWAGIRRGIIREADIPLQRGRRLSDDAVRPEWEAVTDPISDLAWEKIGPVGSFPRDIPLITLVYSVGSGCKRGREISGKMPVRKRNGLREQLEFGQRN